jgi:NAD+ diphosphatase
MKDLFSSAMIQRKAWERTDSAQMKSRLEQDSSRIIVWFEGQLVVAGASSAYFSWNKLVAHGDILSPPIFLGQHQSVDYFTCQFEQWADDLDGLQLSRLRQACRLFDDFHLSLLFHAQGILNWHKNHSFCSGCGAKTQITQAGHARVCEAVSCAKTHYPKLDPAVIFAVANNNGAEPRLLLARKKEWDEFRYSVLAGFVEPGETLEDSVKREAYEESGLVVESVEYVASQPWPFPDALMLGFRCETTQQEIALIDQELESARWFSAGEIESAICSGEFKMPFEFSIAWHLIDNWFVQQKGYSLKSAASNPGCN